MRIKFRQKLKPDRDKFNEGYHYWGYIDGGFISPFGKNICMGDSEQFTGALDSAGNEVYVKLTAP